MPGLMVTFPGLQPWHFGGEERYTWRESRVLVDAYQEKVEQDKKQEQEMQRKQRESERKSPRRR